MASPPMPRAGDHGSERNTEETRGEKDQGDQGGEVAQPEEGANQLAVDAALLHTPGLVDRIGDATGDDATQPTEA